MRNAVEVVDHTVRAHQPDCFILKTRNNHFPAFVRIDIGTADNTTIHATMTRLSIWPLLHHLCHVLAGNLLRGLELPKGVVSRWKRPKGIDHHHQNRGSYVSKSRPQGVRFWRYLPANDMGGEPPSP
jgi:hypothetical protein